MSRTMTLMARTALALALIIAAPAPAVGAGRAGGLPRPDHTLIVIFENKSFQRVMGGSKAPYLRSLGERRAVFTASYGLTYPSQPNYLALFSGSTQGVTDNHCPVHLTGRANLGRQLLDAGLTFTGYSENMPYAGFRGCGSPGYAAKHNPWVDFDNLPPSVNQPYTAFPADYAALPTMSFVVPNLCHDMHDCPVSDGDRWARHHIEGYLRWAQTHNSLLIVTFDTDDHSEGNRIPTIFAGPMVKPGRYGERIDHYTVLRTVEDLYGLAPLGHAGTAGPITDVWR